MTQVLHLLISFFFISESSLNISIFCQILQFFSSTSMLFELSHKTYYFTLDITYRIAESGELVDVNFKLSWRACTKYFDFDTDLDPHVMADAIAREAWSRNYFETLKK